jgi:hypothetical protein
MAFSAYYTSLIDIANNKFLDVKDPPLTVIDFVYLAKIVDIGLYLQNHDKHRHVHQHIQRIKDDEDILFSGATTVGNLFAVVKLIRPKTPKKPKKQNRAAYKNNAGWRT